MLLDCKPLQEAQQQRQRRALEAEDADGHLRHLDEVAQFVLRQELLVPAEHDAAHSLPVSLRLLIVREGVDRTKTIKFAHRCHRVARL